MRKLPAQAALGYARRKGWIDVPLGLEMMRDRNVPVGIKVRSLGLGFLLMLIVQALEFPLQEALVLMTGLLGLPFSIALDGFEFIVLPILFGAAILARTAPRRPTIPNVAGR